jgi:DNA-binding CsgD family transcriptional regulator
MMQEQSSGDYLKTYLTNEPADINSDEYTIFSKTIPRFPEEAVYIYSLKKGRMIYSAGWEEVLGYKDAEMGILTFVTITSPEYAPFSNELNEKALMFILRQTEDLEQYSFTLETKKTHKDGTAVPMITRVGVFKSEGGRVTEIICRAQVVRTLKLGKVMRYSLYGPERSVFDDELNKLLFHHYAISGKEKEALALVAQGYSFKEIAAMFNVSQSAIEKRILPLYRRFDVKSISHLVSFAYENHILP